MKLTVKIIVTSRVKGAKDKNSEPSQIFSF